MGECKIDHSLTDVKKKLEDQQSYLPEVLYEKLTEYLQTEKDQEELNVLFHLLKKYDLVEAEEQKERNAKLEALLN